MKKSLFCKRSSTRCIKASRGSKLNFSLRRTQACGIEIMTSESFENRIIPGDTRRPKWKPAGKLYI